MKKSFLNYSTSDGAVFTKDRNRSSQMNQQKSFPCSISGIEIWPVIRVCSVLFGVMGLIVGVLAFLVFPHPSSAGLSFSTRFLSAILFAFLYSAILTAGISLFVWLYNIFAARLSWGVKLHFTTSDIDD